MSYVHTAPTRAKTTDDTISAAVRRFEPRTMAVRCPICERGIYANALDKHLTAPAETNAARIAQGFIGGHGMDIQKAALYRARAINQAEVALRELAERDKGRVRKSR